jgi:hypothetical protein
VTGNHALALATLIFAAERQAHAEAKRLLAAALERIPPQLEAPRIAGEHRSKKPIPERGGGAQEGAQPRSWWRRMFGG